MTWETHFQPPMRDLLIGTIVVLWGGATLLRSYLRARNRVKADITAELKKQYGEQATVKSFAFRPRLLGIRFDSPLFGTFRVGSAEAEAAQHTLESARGTIALVKFNPADPRSVQEAIEQYDRDVDAKLGHYPQNKIVAETRKKLKRDFRHTVEEQVKKFAHSAAEHK
jgi:hypothetical protein